MAKAAPGLILALAFSARAQTIALQTDGDGSARLSEHSVVSSPAPADVEITLAPDALSQSWEGVGAALTDSAATVIAAMPAQARMAFIRQMFDPRQGGFNLVRLTIGASDFSASGAYTYAVRPGSFDLSHDLMAIVPVLRDIRSVQAGLRLLAAPWSPPPWMKTSERLNGGAIAPGAYPALAEYLVRYALQYRAWGLPIWALSPQNEPLLSRADYPTALLPAPEEARFVHDFLAPAVRRAGIGTRILGLEHNWGDLPYARALAGSPAAADFAGYAFHCYRGDPGSMGAAREMLRPGQVMLMTECSPTRGGGFAQGFRYTMTMLVMGTIRNGGSGIVMWNMALDPAGGPTIGGCGNCVGVATVTGQGAVTYDPSFYALAQVGHAVRPGARVFGAQATDRDIEVVAFRNPDGGIVVVAYNAGSRPHRLGLLLGQQRLTYSLPANAAVTFATVPGE